MAETRSPAYRRQSGEARRAALIEATLDCLGSHGLHGTTVRRIAAAADMSPGLLTHYFDGKDELIRAAYLQMTDRFVDAYVAAAAGAGDDPEAALAAFIEASFREPLADPGRLPVWLTYWSLVTTDAEFRALHAENYARHRGELESLLRRVLRARGAKSGKGRRRRLAIGIGALADGLWLEWSLDPGTFDLSEAEGIAKGFVAGALGNRC